MPVLIRYRGRVAAVATARRAYLSLEIELLPDGHPDKRFVAFMVLFAMDLEAGRLQGQFSQRAAEQFAVAAVRAAEDG